MLSQVQAMLAHLVATYSEFTLVAIFTWAIAVIVYYAYGGVMFLIDLHHRPEVLYAYKIQPDKQFVAAGSHSNPPLGRLLRSLLFAQFCIALPASIVWHYAAKAVRPFGMGVYVSAELPSLKEFLLHIGVFLVVEDIFFYYAHRMLHNRWFYQRVHKVHHQFHAPIALAANYAHPVEVLCANLWPLSLGPWLVGAHVFTLWFWIAAAIIATQTHHCGYRFPWHVPGDEQPNFHDFHHERFTGNYGLSGVLDWLHGTDKEWQKHRKLRVDRITSRERQPEGEFAVGDAAAASAAKLKSASAAGNNKATGSAVATNAAISGTPEADAAAAYKGD